MKLKVDAEAKKTIESLCDVALRAGGIKNLNEVGKLLQDMESSPEKVLEITISRIKPDSAERTVHICGEGLDYYETYDYEDDLEPMLRSVAVGIKNKKKK